MSEFVLKTATVIFAVAVIHTLVAPKIHHFRTRFRTRSFLRSLFFILGEVELVFGFWALVLLSFLAIYVSPAAAAEYFQSVSFHEPIFVFVMMLVASTKPVLETANFLLNAPLKICPAKYRAVLFVALTMTFGCFLGSLITEPAAMTVVALLLGQKIFSGLVSTRLKYGLIGLLFVNISIGGALTHFAAPPIVMVARKWGWDLQYVFSHFGIVSIVAGILNTSLLIFVFQNELLKLPFELKAIKFPWKLRLRESFLVAAFLAGLVVLGNLQEWWIKPLLESMGPSSLFWGATGLTSFTDNAALAYLATLATNLSEEAKLSILKGAIAGGGLTIIANAPNPAGYGILKEYFGARGINPFWLFVAALPFTLVVCLVNLIL